MARNKMLAQIFAERGLVAALDESGGSTPCALRSYDVLGQCL
jgi:fructose-bisphosphate aldolase class 1